MSYSFTVTAATKAEAKAKVAAELAKVRDFQPIHTLDRGQAQSAANAFIELVPHDEAAYDVHVSMHGAVSWNGSEAEPVITGASVSISAAVMPRG